MSTSKVDSKKRVVLPNGRPGDVFDIQQQDAGRYVLVKLERPEPLAHPNREECLEAIKQAPLKPSMSWEELSKLTRGE